MKRLGLSSKIFTGFLGLCLSFGLFASTIPDSTAFQNINAPTLKPTKANTITVTEFFSLACPHCFELEHLLEPWLKTKPKNVLFQRIPVGFGRASWMTLAQGFLVAKALNKQDTIVPALFSAIHIQGLAVWEPDVMASIFAQHGVSPTEFNQYFRSFSINQQWQKIAQLNRSLKIMGVPTIIINGQYKTSPTLAGNNKKMMKAVKAMITYLESKHSAKRKPSQKT